MFTLRWSHSLFASFPVGSNRCISSWWARVISAQWSPRDCSNLCQSVPSHREDNWQHWIDYPCQRVLSDTPWICRQAPGCGENVWRSSQGLRSENILWFRLKALFRFRAFDTFGRFFQRWVGFKTDLFDVDSRMQEADEQSEGKKTKPKTCVWKRRRRVGAQQRERERGRERSFGLFSGCLINPCDYMLWVVAAADMFFPLLNLFQCRDCVLTL